jgi:gluconate 5-dehydrogenase
MSNDVEKSIAQLFDLTGKTAMITGGTGWLGGAMSRALAEAGARVIITSSRSQGAAQQSASDLPAPKGQKHLGVQLDHMDEAKLLRGFDEAVKLAGGIDVLVNNGLEPQGKDWTNISGEEFTRNQVNNTGYFLLARAFRNHCVSRGVGGSVINIGSMYGTVASYPDAYEGLCAASSVSYHALKGGLIHMTRHLSVYWARDGVRVNTLSPGPFPKDAFNNAVVDRLIKKVPMGRMGKPQDLKGTLVLLASDAGAYITGQNITIDGGWTAW